ncbi:mRNA-decapping enzyme subunit 2 [Coemansia sp. Benny D115]|nr:mRNA-decapping enzyme subunit 2 [Coemansia sp. Benny D115]
MFEDATFSEVLDDLASRFIINVPEEELQEIERICFQIEQAHWFYEDFVREKNRALPSMSLKTFAARMFKHCPLLSQWAHDSEAAYQTFLEYKFKVPVCGAIILNPNLDKVLLVKGWSSRSSWGFPRGKINKDEPEWQCAQREVIEETGFDILPYLVEKQRIELTQADQKISLYIIAGIPEETSFVPTVRKEISQISWHNIADLPCGGRMDKSSGSAGGMAAMSASGSNGGGSKSSAEKEHRYYLIKPFAKRIKAWVAKHPEKIGRLATVVNPKGQPPSSSSSLSATAAAARAVSCAPAAGGSPLPQRQSQHQQSGSGAAMSVQELFKTVGRAMSPVNINGTPQAQSAAAGSYPHMYGASPSPVYGNAVSATPRPDSRPTASLLQTLMGTSNASPAYGSAPLAAPEATGAGAAQMPTEEGNKLAALSNLMRLNGISATPPPPGLIHAQQQQQQPHPLQANPPAAPSPLRGFAFDTRAIMNAYANFGPGP